MAIFEPEPPNAELMKVSPEAVVSTATRAPRGALIAGDSDAVLRRMLALGDAASVVLSLTIALTLGAQPAELLIGKLAAHPEFRSKVIGALSDEGVTPSSFSPVPVLGTVEQLERVVVEHNVRRVIVSSIYTDDQHQLEELLRRCRKL